jgi:hypothetical protein
MVAFDLEGTLAGAEDLDLAAIIGLDPDRGVPGADMAQQRPED